MSGILKINFIEKTVKCEFVSDTEVLFKLVGKKVAIQMLVFDLVRLLVRLKDKVGHKTNLTLRFDP